MKIGQRDGVEVHTRACNLCESICGLLIEVENERVRSIRPDPDDFFSRGHICPKATALKDVQEDPDRIRTPLRRVGDRFEAISWDRAFREIAERCAEIVDAHGENAVAYYRGNPIGHNYGLMTHFDLLRAELPTVNNFSANSVDGLPTFLTAYWMYGHAMMWPIPDIDRTDHFVMLGGNPMASNGSAMTAPGIRKRIEAIRARGGRFVLIDPRRTESARLADEHHFIRPHSDAALMAAMLHTIFEEDLGRTRGLEASLVGFEDLETSFRPFSPERVARWTGIEAGTIRRLTREFAAADSAVFYARMGVAVQPFATTALWLTQLLNIVTGNLDRPGGVLWPTPALPRETLLPRCEFGDDQTRLRKLPSFTGELPVAALGEEILSEGEGAIRALFCIAGNPVLSTPNGRQLDAAFAKLDLMVSVDLYLNETSRHADYFLPSPGPLEHDNYNLFFHMLSVRDTVRYDEPVLPRKTGVLDDWEIYAGLVNALREVRGRDALEIPSSSELLDGLLQAGPYGSDNVDGGLDLDRLRNAPRGIDLGPLKPRLSEGLPTISGKVECLPAPLVADLERLKQQLASESWDEGLVLIGRRELRGNGSWMHNAPRLNRGSDRCVLLVHPRDLAARGLRDGQRARVSSRVGAIEVPVQASETMMPGVVCLPHGYGHDRPGVRLRVARAKPGASYNDLADDTQVDPISGTAVLNGIPVALEGAPEHATEGA